MNLAIASNKKKIERLMLALIILGIVLLSMSAINVLASGLGGYISEKLVASSGTTNSALLIDRFGVSNTDLDMVLGPAIDVLPATDVIFDGAGTHATLRGTLTSLNGFPTSNVWFEWGYAPAALSSSTPIQVANVVGTYSATINHYIASNTVYYRFVGQTDGNNYSSTTTFQLTGGSGGSPMTSSLPIMQIATLLLAVGIIIFMLNAISQIENPLYYIIIIGIIILVGVYFITSLQSLLNSMF